MNAHGSIPGYKSGCRCEACRKANADYQRSWRERNRKQNRTPPKHGGRAYSNYGCRCEECLSAQREVQRKFTTSAQRNTNKERQAASVRRSTVKFQERTLDRAGRHGRQWTGPEMEVLARTDLTREQKALMLGRSYKAVDTKMYKLRKGEPTPLWLAGQRAKLHG